MRRKNLLFSVCLILKIHNAPNSEGKRINLTWHWHSIQLHDLLNIDKHSTLFALKTDLLLQNILWSTDKKKRYMIYLDDFLFVSAVFCCVFIYLYTSIHPHRNHSSQTLSFTSITIRFVVYFLSSSAFFFPIYLQLFIIPHAYRVAIQ